MDAEGIHNLDNRDDTGSIEFGFLKQNFLLSQVVGNRDVNGDKPIHQRILSRMDTAIFLRVRGEDSPELRANLEIFNAVALRRQHQDLFFENR